MKQLRTANITCSSSTLKNQVLTVNQNFTNINLKPVFDRTTIKKRYKRVILPKLISK